MKPIPSHWLRLVEPYRNADWLECADILRPMVDQYPDDLGTRLLYGVLCVAADQAGLGLVQFEKLLQLSVGQNDLFRALAAQKQLDRLRPAGSVHDKRFVAIHQWFCSLATRRGHESDDHPVPPRALLALPPAAFHRLAEQAAIDDLGMAPHDLDADSDSARIVLYGRVRWSVAPEGDSSLISVVADELEPIAVEPELASQGRLALVPELPSACLRFDLAQLRSEQENAPRTQSEPPPAAAPAGRPVPDPLFEPTAATAPSLERRRETRASVSFKTRVAMLGLAGSRVAPFEGRLLNLSPAGLGLGFPRAELRAVREELEGSLLTVEIELGGGEPLQLMSRVRWVQLAPQTRGALPEDMGVLGLEFILVSARERTRIEGVLIHAARAGQPLDAGAGGEDFTIGEADSAA
ncbi:MAG TPA: PilZ domain-containing protein [Candidatus Eisenbacteria bacterium]